MGIDNKSGRMKCMEVWGGNRAVQRSIETPGLCTWVYSKPYGECKSGGDVYYLSSCASGRITRLLLADVSGHGDVISDVAIGLRDLMRLNVNYIKQTRLVSAMNEQFSTLTSNGDFATAVVSTFFAPTRTLTLCNAGHPAPLLYRSKTSQWSELISDTDSLGQIGDTPFGVWEQAEYSQSQIVLEEGDLVISFSDSLIESEDASGEQLGTAGILKLVSAIEFEHPDQIIPSLVKQLDEFKVTNLDQDDTTIVLCQATGSPTPLKNTLFAPLRLFQAVSDATLID
jgi:phosphoserine phosphatase RsbU/P